MPFSIIPFFLLVIPILEIIVFIWVGGHIGILATLGLVLATAVTGSILLRTQGFGVIQRMRRTLDEGRLPGRDLVHGVMILVAGILLLMPGFVTDTLGLLLFIPAVRDAAWTFLRKRVVIIGMGDPGTAERPQRGEKNRTIDLDVEDYSRSDKKDSPWRGQDSRTD